MALKKTTAKSGYLYKNETMFIPSISQITKMGENLLKLKNATSKVPKGIIMN